MHKKTLIILPGWGGSHETWVEFIVAAEKYFEVKCIDLPCFGEEPCPSTVWGVADYAQFVTEKIQTLHKTKEDLVVLGHSFGGAVATYIAANNAQLFDTLILSGAAVMRPRNSLKRIIFFVLAKCGTLVMQLPVLKRLQPFAKKLLYKVADSPDFVKTSGMERDIFQKIIREDLRAVLPRVQARTLVLWGALDRYVPLKWGAYIAENIQNAQFVVFSDGTHGLHQKKTQEFLSAIIEFTK